MVAEAVPAELLLGESAALQQDAPCPVEDDDALRQQPLEAGEGAVVRRIGSGSHHRAMLAQPCDPRSEQPRRSGPSRGLDGCDRLAARPGSRERPMKDALDSLAG